MLVVVWPKSVATVRSEWPAMVRSEAKVCLQSFHLAFVIPAATQAGAQTFFRKFE